MPSFTVAIGKEENLTDKIDISKENFEGDIQLSDGNSDSDVIIKNVENEHESEKLKDSKDKTRGIIQKIIYRFPNLERFFLFNKLGKDKERGENLEKITNAISNKLEEKSRIFSSKFSKSKESDRKVNVDTISNEEKSTIGLLSTTDGSSDATVVPESGHISIMGSGQMTVDSILDIDGSIIVTLQGSLYMDTNMESIDIWWNLSSGYFEINADGLSEGNPFELNDFLIDIRENCTNPGILTINIGYLSADAGASVKIENNMAVGTLNINGVLQIHDVDILASNLPFGDLTLAGSFDCYGEIGADDITLSWNETIIAVDGSALADGSMSIEIRDFYIDVALGTLQFERLNIYGEVLLHINKLNFSSSNPSDTSYSDIIFEASGKLTLYNISAVIQNKQITASLIDTEISLIIVSRDSGDFNHVEGEGYLEICDFDFSSILSFKRLFIEGSIELTHSSDGFYLHVSAYAQIEEFHYSSGGIYVEFDVLTADVYAILEMSSQSVRLTAGGYLNIKALSAYFNGISVVMQCGSISGNGYIWVHSGTIDIRAGVSIGTTYTHISGMGHDVSWSSLGIDASLDLHIGGNIEIHAGASLSICGFNLDGSYSWSQLSISASGSLFIHGNTIEISGDLDVYISNGHFGSYVDHVTGSIGLNAAGTATFVGSGSCIEFSASAGGYISSFTFSGSGFDFTVSSFTLNLGGSGTFTPKTNGFEFSGSADLSVSNLVVNSPYEINIPSLDFDISGSLDVTVTGVGVDVEANGKVSTGYLSIVGHSIQLDFDGNIAVCLDVNSLTGSISGSGSFSIHYENHGGIVIDIGISGLGGTANINLNTLSYGSLNIDTGGGQLTLHVSSGEGALVLNYNDITIAASGSGGLIWTLAGNERSFQFSGSIDIDLSLKSYGEERVLVSGNIDGGGAIDVILQKGTGNFPTLPPEYCFINLNFNGEIDFKIKGFLWGSIGDCSGHLEYNKYEAIGQRLQVEGELCGNIKWWDPVKTWVQILPWPWLEQVTLKAKDKNGVWQTGSVNVDPGNVNFLASVDVEGDLSLRYDFSWGDGSPGISKDGQGDNCLASHEYIGEGSFSAQVQVYDGDWLLGTAQITINICSLEVSLSSNKKIYNYKEEAIYTATVGTSSSNSGDSSDSNDNSNNYLTYSPGDSSANCEYIYDFNFGDGSTANIGPNGNSVSVSDVCEKASGILDTITVTVFVTEADLSGNPTGRTGSASCEIRVLGGLIVSLRVNKNLADIDEELIFTAKVIKDFTSDSTDSTNSDTTNYAPGSGVYSYEFSFGDGGTASAGPTSDRTVTQRYAYIEPGIKIAKVHVTNTQTGAEGKGTAIVIVRQNLDVTLTAVPKTPKVEEMVTFTATVTSENCNADSSENNYASFVSSDEYNYVFEFRDGSSKSVSSGTQASVTHQYLETGIYVAKVTVTSENGGGIAQTTVYVGEGDLICTPGELNFGSVDPGQSKSASFTVTNMGDASVSWDSRNIGRHVSHSPASGSLQPGGSTEVEVTITAPSRSSASSSSTDNVVDQTQRSEGSQPSSSESFSFDSFEDVSNFATTGQKEQINRASPLGRNKKYTSYIRVFDIDNRAGNFDVVVVTFNSMSSSPVADAGMNMKVDAKKALKLKTFQTIPRVYIDDIGKPTYIDGSYSAVANSDGSYGVKQNGISIIDNLKSAEFVQSYAATGDIPDYGEEDGDDGTCCFPAGTMITMSDGSCKPIEEVKLGDYVLSYDTYSGSFISEVVKEIVKPVRSGVYSINDGIIYPTDDHPFYTKKSDGRIGWASIDPEKSELGYLMNPMKLEVGDEMFTNNEKWIEIVSIEHIKDPIQTYNLEDVSGESTFFANNILVHNAVDCGNQIDPDLYSMYGENSYSYENKVSYTESKNGSNSDIVKEVPVQFNGVGSVLSTYSNTGSVSLNTFMLKGANGANFLVPNTKPVSDIEKGDKVLSSIGSKELYSVSSPTVFKKRVHSDCFVDYVTISVDLKYMGLEVYDRETGGRVSPDVVMSSTFSVTSDYLVLVDGSFIPASDVREGNVLYNIDGEYGYNMTVTNVDHYYGKVGSVHDLVLSGFGGYFVNGAIVKSPCNYGEMDSNSGVLFGSMVYVPFEYDSNNSESDLSSFSQYGYYSNSNLIDGSVDFSTGLKDMVSRVSKNTNNLENILIRLAEKFPILNNIPFIQRLIEQNNADTTDDSDQDQNNGDENLPDESDEEGSDEGSDDSEEDNNSDDEVIDDPDENQDSEDNNNSGDGNSDEGSDDSENNENQSDDWGEIEEDTEEDVDLDSVRFVWDFGDGNIGFGVNPVHNYCFKPDDLGQDTGDSSSIKYDYSVTYTTEVNAILMLIDQQGNVVDYDLVTTQVELPFRATLITDPEEEINKEPETSYKNIEDLTVKDRTISHANRKVPDNIIDINKKDALKLSSYVEISYKYSDNEEKSNSLKVLPGQPIYSNYKYVAAEQIQAGDKLYTINDKEAMVTSVKKASDYFESYQLTLERYHTFYVNDILVGDKTKSGSNDLDAEADNIRKDVGILSGQKIAVVYKENIYNSYLFNFNLHF